MILHHLNSTILQHSHKDNIDLNKIFKEFILRIESRRNFIGESKHFIFELLGHYYIQSNFVSVWFLELLKRP